MYFSFVCCFEIQNYKHTDACVARVKGCVPCLLSLLLNFQRCRSSIQVHLCIWHGALGLKIPTKETGRTFRNTTETIWYGKYPVFTRQTVNAGFLNHQLRMLHLYKRTSSSQRTHYNNWHQVLGLRGTWKILPVIFKGKKEVSRVKNQHLPENKLIFSFSSIINQPCSTTYAFPSHLFKGKPISS